jgi:hypothetical protein
MLFSRRKTGTFRIDSWGFMGISSSSSSSYNTYTYIIHRPTHLLHFLLALSSSSALHSLGNTANTK